MIVRRRFQLRPPGTTAGLVGLLLAALAAFTGCNRAVQVENPIEIGAEEYHHVYEAAVDVLRDHRFRIDRQDRRFGVVTTGPLIAASAFEPWHDDNTTADQVLENTLNHQRRRVRIELYPVTRDGDAGDELVVNPSQPAGTTAPVNNTYELLVQVFVERRQHPPRELNGSVFAGVELRRQPRLHESIVTEEGVIESHWRPLRRDHELEQRLVAAILRRSIDIQPVYPPQARAE